MTLLSSRPTPVRDLEQEALLLTGIPRAPAGPEGPMGPCAPCEERVRAESRKSQGRGCPPPHLLLGWAPRLLPAWSRDPWMQGVPPAPQHGGRPSWKHSPVTQPLCPPPVAEWRILTASPLSPCLPVGPAGPGEPGGPGAPGAPTAPVSPRSPCQERGLRLREEHSRRGRDRRSFQTEIRLIPACQPDQPVRLSQCPPSPSTNRGH